jgi:hypothetical protein
MTGPLPPPFPAGHDYDFINADAILHRLAVRDGRLVLPDGNSYAALLLPDSATMRPAVARKIGELAAAGAKIIGSKPTHSPSLQAYPKCDEETRKLATWNALPNAAALALPPDVIAPSDILWTHRRTPDSDIYFISNQTTKERSETISFRVTGRPASLWNAINAEIQTVPHAENNGRSSVTVNLPPRGSIFVVFGPGTPVTVAAAPSSAQEIPVAGPWKLDFPTRQVTLPELACWTTMKEDELRHHSGAAVYSTEVDIANPSGRVVLDLGRVESLATVTLNGKTFPTLWTDPYQVDVTSALKPGRNSLKVEVINTWYNRLAGDAGLPKEKRVTRIPRDTFKPGTPPQSAGLLGPVRVQMSDSSR